MKKKISKADKKNSDLIDEASKESFPSSDPPAWTLGSNQELESALSAKKDHNLTLALLRENQIIRDVIITTDKLIKAIQQKKSIPPTLLVNLVKFLHDIADESHQQKEEAIFPTLMRKDSHPSNYVMHDLENEHEYGRQLIARLNELTAHYKNGDQSVELINTLKDIKHLYFNHLAKEEEYVFPYIDQCKADEQKTFLDKINKIDENIGASSRNYSDDLARNVIDKIEQASL